ncbi:MAG: hypothetical protein NVS2B9_21090 [Myxococcales bacterium]
MYDLSKDASRLADSPADWVRTYGTPSRFNAPASPALPSPDSFATNLGVRTPGRKPGAG